MRDSATASASRVIEGVPVGSLVRVRWLEELDSGDADPGVDLSGHPGETVVVTRWLTDTAFCRPGHGLILGFECLWRGRIMRTSTYAIERVIECAN